MSVKAEATNLKQKQSQLNIYADQQNTPTPSKIRSRTEIKAPMSP